MLSATPLLTGSKNPVEFPCGICLTILGHSVFTFPVPSENFFGMALCRLLLILYLRICCLRVRLLLLAQYGNLKIYFL